MAQLQVTLSRAHKIAERLKARISELLSEANALSAPVHVTGLTGSEQVQRLQAQGDKALAVLASADHYARALTALRAAIGHENEARGISAMLAELDGVNRLLGARKELLNNVKENGLAPGELATYKPISPNERGLLGGVTVQVLQAAHREQLEASQAALQRQSFALSDRIAEANAARFSVELSDDIVAEVTGA